MSCVLPLDAFFRRSLQHNTHKKLLFGDHLNHLLLLASPWFHIWHGCLLWRYQGLCSKEETKGIRDFSLLRDLYRSWLGLHQRIYSFCHATSCSHLFLQVVKVFLLENQTARKCWSRTKKVCTVKSGLNKAANWVETFTVSNKVSRFPNRATKGPAQFEKLWPPELLKVYDSLLIRRTKDKTYTGIGRFVMKVKYCYFDH